MATVNKNTGKVTVQKGDTPASIAKAVSAATGQKVTAAQISQAISANPTLAARQKAGTTVLFSGTTFKVPGITAGAGTSTPDTGASVTKTVISITNNADGSVTIKYSDGTEETRGGGGTLPSAQQQASEQQRISAFAILEKEFQDANLPSLAAEVRNFMKQGLEAEEASLRLPETEAYKQRFAGNVGRISRGLPIYRPNEYIQAEQTYRDLFSQYGLPELATQETYNSLIGGAVSIDEAKTRITNVFNRIDSAPTELKQQLNQYFSQYGVGDPTKQRSQIALALMQGPQGITQLEADLRKAQIRTGAALSSVSVEEPYVTELEKQLSAYSPEQVSNIAKEAYATVAEVAPTVEKLAQISGESTTGLKEEVTQEAINKSLGVVMPSQRRKKLQEQEQARFAGQAGTSQVSLAQKTSAGQF